GGDGGGGGRQDGGGGGGKCGLRLRPFRRRRGRGLAHPKGRAVCLAVESAFGAGVQGEAGGAFLGGQSGEAWISPTGVITRSYWQFEVSFPERANSLRHQHPVSSNN